VRPVQDFGDICKVCDDHPEDADFWSLYGLLKQEQDHGITTQVCIGDFSTREAAETIKGYISGR
jgi:hypothetical protein